MVSEKQDSNSEDHRIARSRGRKPTEPPFLLWRRLSAKERIYELLSSDLFSYTFARSTGANAMRKPSHFTSLTDLLGKKVLILTQSAPKALNFSRSNCNSSGVHFVVFTSLLATLANALITASLFSSPSSCLGVLARGLLACTLAVMLASNEGCVKVCPCAGALAVPLFGTGGTGKFCPVCDGSLGPPIG